MSEVAERHVERIVEREHRRQARLEVQRAEFGPEVLSLAPRVLLAEGDSWFDYPGTDVLNELEGLFGYEIHSGAHRGDTIESMAYGERQLDGLNRLLAKLAEHNKRPEAILLSGGGNDIAGDELRLLLDHASSRSPGLNTDIVRGLIDVRLREAYEILIETIALLHEEHFGTVPTKFVVHGYARPVPDGRGFFGGWGPLPGPWLEPGFHQRGFLRLPANTQLMSDLIDRFNDMLTALAQSTTVARVVYVDVRPALRNDLVNDSYRLDWDNELHPEESGFQEVAKLIHAQI